MSYVDIFELENGKLVPTVHCHTLGFLKDIMDKYKKEDEYMKIYEYIFYMTCPYPKKNPFFNIAEVEREGEVLRHIRLNTSLDDDLIVIAKTECEKLFTSKLAQAYKSMAIGVENISNYVRTTCPTDGRDGNITALLKAIEHYPKLREAFDKIETAFLASQKVVNVRGDEDMAYDQVNQR